MKAYRFPRFAVAATTSALVLVALVCLIVIDRDFSNAAVLAAVDLGWNPRADIDPEGLDEAHVRAGWRLWVIAALGLLAIVSTLVMLGRLFAGTFARRNGAAILTAIVIMAGWLGLFTEFERLLDYSIYRQVERQIPELKVLAQRLRVDWPEYSAEIPPLGYLSKDPDHPDMLMLAETEISTPFNWIGAIQKNDNAILFHFAFISSGPVAIEFHQGATTPESFAEEVRQATYRHDLASFEAIDEGVFLSQYHESIEFENGEVIQVLYE
jgi:hypothetical protein